jgi:K+-transporting ATPase KdpF subunit
MKNNTLTKLFSLSIVPLKVDPTASNGSASYIIGGIIALLILGYLIYTLMRPEKF